MDAELRINRLNTTVFIAARPSEIALQTQRRERTAGAGFKLVPDYPREPQTFRIIELGTQTTPPIVTLTDGKQREVAFWLLGEHDAQVARDDYWVAEDGREWLVGDIVRPNGYETRALVVERGR